ncbi:hypothetical protein AXFE_17570 [Acidithrix ferrooxidans]|uniref:Uncharacterized protein n=1 Tax=Acidithrix ferrooxidans TaxID=1280514 RepID=A0A0D8HHJ7_9ACTN|nr:hypothetical protein AXFE_17570 [Acidithrix ferrooxidans]
MGPPRCFLSELQEGPPEMPEAPWLLLYLVIPTLWNLNCWVENFFVHPVTECFGNGHMRGREPFVCVTALRRFVHEDRAVVIVLRPRFSCPITF